MTQPSPVLRIETSADLRRLDVVDVEALLQRGLDQLAVGALGRRILAPHLLERAGDLAVVQVDRNRADGHVAHDRDRHQQHDPAQERDASLTMTHDNLPYRAPGRRRNSFDRVPDPAPGRTTRSLQVPIEPDPGGLADQQLLIHEAPPAAVLAVVPVVPDHQVAALRHPQHGVARIRRRRRPPRCRRSPGRCRDCSPAAATRRSRPGSGSAAPGAGARRAAPRRGAC